jgi:ubiquinone/menaquinone biosynthesis C-methylase UbiE
MPFQLSSYESHKQVKHESDLVQQWKFDKTVDYLRHERMYTQLTPILLSYPGAFWLTVGDGRFGTDAHYLTQMKANAIASDINDTYLKQAKEEGFISAYAIENAEQLSYDDNHFDFVLCKESYHHFPRPMIAFYEMLRVCKKGIILIEPNDQSVLDLYHSGLNSAAYWFFFALKQKIKKLLGKKSATFSERYESVGNYVYTISRREFEKAALGLNLDAIAVKGLNDFYYEGMEYEDIDEHGPLLRKLKSEIVRLDKISSRRSETFGILITIIFKTAPTQTCINKLKKYKFDFKFLEKNPHAKSL